MRIAILLTGALLAANLRPVLADAPASKPLPEELTGLFENHVRPVLVEKCYGCHGPKKQRAGLRLDSRAAILKGSDGGAVVEPGDPEASALVHAIRQDDLLKMPPPPNEKLSTEAIDAISEWIRLGMPWPDDSELNTAEDTSTWKSHWAYQPIRRPTVPMDPKDRWPRTPIDRFIVAKLGAKGLSPSPPADRRTLLRRITFDLTGLPPTPEEVAAFEADSSPNASTKLIDRLLASPRYGERWGRYWLDVARYADNKGYVFFEEKTYPWAYAYRDYVIRAFNEDLPYDQFLLEQLAADQLGSPAALPAMGFLTLGARFMNNTHDILDDRIDVTTRGLLGLTVTCARCHDHKFDPIPQTDYYSLYGVFRSSVEPTIPPLFASPPETEAYRDFAHELEKRHAALESFVLGKHAELVTAARRRAGEYLRAAHATRDQPPTDDFMLLVMEGELNPTMLLRWKIYLGKTARKHDPVWAPWHAFAKLPEEQFALHAADVAGKFAESQDSGTAINPLVRTALFVTPPMSIAEVADRYASVLNRIDERWQEVLTEAAEKGRAAPIGFDDPAQEELRQVFYGPEAPANVPVDLGQGFLTLLPDRPAQEQLKKLLKEVETWISTGKGAPPRALVLVDSDTPYEPRVFLRGNPHRLGGPVTRRFLSALGGGRTSFQQGSGRLELARALVDRRNPLTARVLVNRVWLHHFGAALVRTPSDFGLRSDAPSHPELLDYLAYTFMENGWSIKDLHRRILRSAVYQQASDDREDCRQVDAENRLLWKMNRRRLDFEAMRDAVLTVSGGLDGTVGGPPVDLLAKGFVTRRSVYGFVDRMNLPGLLRVFDFPSPVASSPRRDQTTVPPQALYWMNNPFVAEAARRLANRPDVQDVGTLDAKTTRLYALLFGRKPTTRELAVAQEFVSSQPPDEAWPRYAHGLMMTNEFVFVD